MNTYVKAFVWAYTFISAEYILSSGNAGSNGTSMFNFCTFFQCGYIFILFYR